MGLPNVQLSPGALISAHAATTSEMTDSLVMARAIANQRELEVEHWKKRAEAAEAELAKLKPPAMDLDAPPAKEPVTSRPRKSHARSC